MGCWRRFLLGVMILGMMGSGAEANEAALKLSRLTGRNRVISTEGSFHGRTMGALSMTGQIAKRKPFKPLLKSVDFIAFNAGLVIVHLLDVDASINIFIISPEIDLIWIWTECSTH